MTKCEAVFLAKQSEGTPSADDFRLDSIAMPEAGDGQLLLETLYLSLDPYLRGKISGRHMSGAVLPGDIMAGETLSRVLESKADGFEPGDIVHSHSGWRTHAAIDASGARKVKIEGVPLSLGLGSLGMPGLAAYAGVTRLAKIKADDCFVVSAASGPVGSMAAQIARMRGARTVAIAGSDEKCNWCTEKAGFEESINYKTEDIREGIARCCPDGVDVYFDNVGGDMLDAVVEQLAIGARVVLCGLIAQYNSATRLPGPPPGLIIRARATMRGLVVYDHEDLRPEMERVCGDWIRSGDIAFNEDMTEGLENAGAAFGRLMRGKNFGKTIVQVKPS